MWNLDWNGNFMKIKFEYKNIVILLMLVEFFEVGFMILNEIDYCLWNNVIYLKLWILWNLWKLMFVYIDKIIFIIIFEFLN